ncbi:putative germin-like protein 2-1 [Salvia splendens]|uniref:putative germin-like protein 2-1 n=1 Tax=Salvia splendens TaxID=180675 RepID=UPI001C27DA31|nr:putative germin-like protein 2-1 [Salvia splendens]
MNLILTLSFVAIIWPSLVLGHEPSPLQDFCVADFNSIGVRVNGFPCLNPKQVTVDHFLFKGLNIVGNTSNYLGVSVNRPTVNEIPGLNTLGMSTVRVDYAVSGVVPPHRHPRASEILVVLEGTVLVGFVTSSPENKLISKVLEKGDVFVFPFGLFHFQQNVGSGNAITMAFLNSQNPGVVIAANAMFGSSPRIDADVLDRALEVDSSVIEKLEAPYH